MAELSHLISHRFRGFSEYENTIIGLNAALDWGVKQVEFDIRVSRCGTPLIYHDEATPDSTGKLRQLSKILASERAQLGGNFAHMPTADALFHAASIHENKATLLVDIKDAGFEDMLVALAHEHRLVDRIIWVSWVPEALYAIRDLLPEARICLSHWCQSPNTAVRKLHKVFEANNGHVPRPKRKWVHGERSGWFVDGPLKGDMLDMVTHICVPAGMVSKALVAYYHDHNIQVSTFSYVTRESLDQAETDFGIDDFFIDAKLVFDTFA